MRIGSALELMRFKYEIVNALSMCIKAKCEKAFTSQPQPPAVDHLPMHVQHTCKACCQLNSNSRPKITEVVKMLG